MLNNCVLMGRFTHTPELKTTRNEKNIVRFSLAVARSRINSESEKETDFIDCVAWNKTAEFICKYFNKGEPIVVIGSLITRQYEDNQGNKRKACEVLAREVNFCAFKKSQSDTENNSDFKDIPYNDDLPF